MDYFPPVSRQVWREIQSNNRFACQTKWSGWTVSCTTFKDTVTKARCMTEWTWSESGRGQQPGQDRGDQRSKDQKKSFIQTSMCHNSYLVLHLPSLSSALLRPQSVTMERNSKHKQVRCHHTRLRSVPGSVGMFSSVLLLDKRTPAEQTEPSSDCNCYAGAAGLLRYRREPGHPMNSATLHSGVPTSNLFHIPASSSTVDQSELLLCPAQVLGAASARLRVLRTNRQTFAGAVLGALARGERSALTNLRRKRSGADVLACPP